MARSPSSLDAKHAAEALRRFGWIGFWAQVVLFFVSAVILLFAIADPSFNINFRSLFRLLPTLGSLIMLGYAIFWIWRYIKLSRDLLSSNPSRHHSRAEISQSLEKGVTINLISLTLTLIAAQTVVGSLMIKTLTMPAGIAVADAGRLVDPLDVFVVQACLFLIIAGVLGIAVSFRLLKQIHPA
ncbi:MAG: DUF3611 family protein [Leptolyngbyaceae cyanobacterium]